MIDNDRILSTIGIIDMLRPELSADVFLLPVQLSLLPVNLVKNVLFF